MPASSQTRAKPEPVDLGEQTAAQDAMVVGQRILKRSLELGVSLSKLSREAGKADGYLSMFIKRGAPEKLPPEVRISLSKTLQIPESLLRVPSQTADLPETIWAGPRPDLPVFREHQEVDHERATEWVPRPAGLDVWFALWIAHARPRLAQGDLVHVTRRPPRPGDVAVLMDGGRVVDVGQVHRSSGQAMVLIGADRAHVIENDARMFKIGQIVLL